MHKDESHQNIVLTLSYDGTRYFGWQKTPTGSSIEEELQKVLEKVLDHPIILDAASRTDRGVHADGQIVRFFTQKKIDQDRLQYSLNQLLPPDIRVKKIRQAPHPAFHPTLDAIQKEYHYFIDTKSVASPFLRFTHWHIPQILQLETMEEACPLFCGTHDFKAFCNSRKNLKYPDTTRHLSKLAIVPLENSCFRIELCANSFLYKMARNIVGTLVQIGQGKLKSADIPKIFDSKKRALAGLTAPAHGLILSSIFYG